MKPRPTRAAKPVTRDCAWHAIATSAGRAPRCAPGWRAEGPMGRHPGWRSAERPRRHTQSAGGGRTRHVRPTATGHRPRARRQRHADQAGFLAHRKRCEGQNAGGDTPDSGAASPDASLSRSPYSTKHRFAGEQRRRRVSSPAPAPARGDLTQGARRGCGRDLRVLGSGRGPTRGRRRRTGEDHPAPARGGQRAPRAGRPAAGSDHAGSAERGGRRRGPDPPMLLGARRGRGPRAALATRRSTSGALAIHPRRSAEARWGGEPAGRRAPAGRSWCGPGGSPGEAAP